MHFGVLPKMSHETETFITNIENFCDWAESANHNTVDARQHLLALMASIPCLENLRNTGSDIDIPHGDFSQYLNDHKKFSSLPFQFYQVVFNPHDIESSDALVTGDLHDDLADIFGDLRCGLELHRSGYKTEALSYWVDSYFYHWGQHASSALWALDEFYRNK